MESESERKKEIENPDSNDENRETERNREVDQEVGGIQLKLGDIISIEAPANRDLHQNTFFIEYIDDVKISIINVADNKKTVLSIREDSSLTDESITSIILLDRSDEVGYARQNGLLPHVWLDVHIGGDIPMIITGEITNLDEDMIELTTFPERETIYIDFEYKGIPQEIPFTKFVIRAKPVSAPSESLVSVDDDDMACNLPVTSPESASFDVTEAGDMIINVPDDAMPDDNIREVLRSLYVGAADIVFGEELDDIFQVVELPEGQKKFGVELQTNDLMDELLSTIPTSKRTKDVMNNIHTLIERFKQLRTKFSQFDENTNVVGYKQLGAQHKPLVEKIKTLATKLQWIIPVITQKRKIYSGVDMDDDSYNDVVPTDLFNELSTQMDLVKQYKQTGKYSHLYANIDPLSTPIETIADPKNMTTLTSNQEVLANLDTIIDNFDNFTSTVSKTQRKKNKEHTFMSQRKFVIQRYNLGMSKKDKVLLKSGKNVFVNSKMTPNDRMTIKSLIVLPESVMKFSQIDLPGTNIMTRANLHQNYLSLFRLLKQKITVSTHTVDNLEQEIKYDDEKDDKSEVNFMKNIKEYTLDERFDGDSDKFENFLRVLIPKTRVIFRLMRKYIHHKYSFVQIVKELEPFMVYSDDITYKQHDEIRYYLKTQITEFSKEYQEKSNAMQGYRNVTFKIPYSERNRVEAILSGEDRDMLKDGYKRNKKEVNERTQLLVEQSSETLFDVLNKDGAILLSDIITASSIKTLISPSNLMAAFEPANIDSEDSVKPRDCVKRYLTKRYTSMKDMQTDNNSDEVFYDTDLDDTPYEIMKLYVKEKKAMPANTFMEFLVESLVRKHNAPTDYAQELARTLIAGRKQVSDGEYAILTIQPTLPKNVDEDKLTAKEKQALAIEAKAMEKVGYYHRVKNHWVHDQDISEEAFIDTNTLFCNIKSDCFKNQANNVCESSKDAKSRMDQMTKARMVKEFENRVDLSIEQLDAKIKAELSKDFKRIGREMMLREVRANKFSNYAFELGKTVIDDELTGSPHARLRDSILGQDDFTKKQTDILKFVELVCREPLQKEDEFWLYCKDTNVKLMPLFYQQLAVAFIRDAEYMKKLDSICVKQGVIEGDAIIDKHSGYVIRKLDSVTEDGFTEEGFRIVTHEVMEKDLDVKIADLFAKKAVPIFENATNESVFNITDAICSNMGIPTEAVQEFVMRTTLELMEKNIQSRAKYEENARIQEKKKADGAKMISYEIYRNRYIFWLIASSILVSIQTAVPSFRVKKTYPGCVRSFSGYPLEGGVEDTTGIKYIACIMHKMKSSIMPWNSIEKLNVEMYVSKIKEVVEKLIVGARPDIMDMYERKRNYMAEHPNELVPDEHSVENWRSFLPPVVPFKMGGLQTISKDFERDFLDTMSKGHKDQHNYLNIVKMKCTQHGYGIIELINRIVKTKDPVLKTASKDPFLENACCNDTQISRPMDYFINDDATIQQYIGVVNSLTGLIQETRNYTRPSLLYHPGFTGIIYPAISENITEEHVYGAFIHYCNFDNDLPVPYELTAICPEKPAGYPVKASMIDKIEFLKKNGKRYTPNDLQSLMTVLRNDRLVQLPKSAVFQQTDVIFDLLDSFDLKASTVVESKFRDHLRAVMSSYKPKVMVVEERDELIAFKNYLTKSNEQMFYEIVRFFDQYGNMTDKEFDKFQEFLLEITTTNLKDNDALFSVTNFVRNSMYSMTKVFPEMILNGTVFENLPAHWKLSPMHYGDLKRKVDDFWGTLKGFHGDLVIAEVLREIQIHSADLFRLIKELPVYMPLTKGEHTYYSLFDNESINMLYVYLWYSMIFEFIVCANNNELLRTDVEEKKSDRRQKNVDVFNVADQSMGLGDGALEVDIQVGNIEDLKTRTAKLLKMLLGIEQGNKQIMLSYDEIAKKIRKERNIEKEKIIDYLGKMDKDERKVEDMFKRYKMGRWNVGLQKGLVQYDEKTYDRERMEADEGGGAPEEESVDIEQMDEAAKRDMARAFEAEAGDISQFGAGYMDGDYYGDDREEDDDGL
jgi:hypothetical protein